MNGFPLFQFVFISALIGFGLIALANILGGGA